ncbi:conserved hypothetical protein [Candidatus Roizmanbacteria bacterium]|nr:conserved hypothetical protein [Candidatus Roizmanbacteria bacterium]
MDDQVLKIECPYCHKKFSAEEAIGHKIKDDISIKAKEEAKKELADEIRYLKEANEKKDQELEKTKKIELELRKEKNQLSDDKKNFELEKQRQLDLEREKIRQQTAKEILEQQHFKIAEKDKQIDGMKKQIEELRIKSENSSQQLQGEVQELDLEIELKKLFPTDVIEEIKKGEKGADVRQIVKTQKGNLCGTILWESKRTKTWKDDFIIKLKEDLRSENANIPIIVTSVMPKTSNNDIDNISGVWICTYPFAMILAELVRQRLVEVAREKFVIKNQGTKADDLYSYIMGHEFRQQVEALVETYITMRSELDREQRAFETIWKRRDAQIEKMVKSTARIVGSIGGKAGSEFPQLKGLDLLDSGK